MIIRNKKNENLVVNTALVVSYFKHDLNKSSNKKPYCVGFTYPSANSEEQIYDYWMFETEQERNAVWDKIMAIFDVAWI